MAVQALYRMIKMFQIEETKVSAIAEDVAAWRIVQVDPLSV